MLLALFVSARFMAAEFGTPSGVPVVSASPVDQPERSPPPIPCGHGGCEFSWHISRPKIMKTWNPLTPDRYRPLESNLTDTKPLIIDAAANPQDILECAVQRLRASSDLLKTLYCLSFKQADVEDIPHITHALYLLTQDGCDLLQVAQQQMLNWKAPVWNWGSNRSYELCESYQKLLSNIGVTMSKFFDELTESIIEKYWQKPGWPEEALTFKWKYSSYTD
jgi:hypothetical protein